MNHLLSGMTFAGALAIAAPVWAQTPTTPNPAGAPSTTTAAPYTQSAPSATSQTAPYAQQTPARPMAPSAAAPAPSSTNENATEPMRGRHAMHRAHHQRYAGHARMHSRAPSDNMANKLNREELGRVSGSSTPTAGYAPQGYPQQGQPPAAPRN